MEFPEAAAGGRCQDGVVAGDVMRSSEVGSLVARCRGKPVRCCPAPRSPVSGGPTHVPGGGPLSLPGTRCPGNVGRGQPTRCFCWPPGVSPREASLCWDPCCPWPGVWRRCPRASPAVLSPQGPLLRWLKVNFSEAFIAWIHIKALRVFVESVLRYGLPVNFQAVLLQPHKKSSTKRLREVLNSVFRHLDQVAAASILDASVEIPGLQLSTQDYFPYVYFRIDLSLLD